MQERAAEPGREPVSPDSPSCAQELERDAASILAKLINSCTDHPWHIPCSLPAREEPQLTFCSGSQSLPSLWHIWIPLPVPGPVCIAHTQQQRGKGSAGAVSSHLELCQGLGSNQKGEGTFSPLICHCCCSQGRPLTL